ncbi:hypothetical protein [Nostoc sp.]
MDISAPPYGLRHAPRTGKVSFSQGETLRERQCYRSVTIQIALP